MLRIFMLAAILFAAISLPASAQLRKYDDDLRKDFWSELYPDGGTDIYCADKFEVNEKGRPHRHGVTRLFSIEHAMPQSWIAEANTCRNKDNCEASSNKDYHWEVSDMHNLHPSNARANSLRNNRKFAKIESGEKRIEGCDLETDKATFTAEPRAIVRGNLARSVLYMSDKYGIPVDSDMLELMKEWSDADPPTRAEIKRNEKIADFQHDGRNQFIDHPERVWTVKFPVNK